MRNCGRVDWVGGDGWIVKKKVINKIINKINKKVIKMIKKKKVVKIWLFMMLTAKHSIARSQRLRDTSQTEQSCAISTNPFLNVISSSRKGKEKKF
jgi:nucleoid DNA-binding protein